MLPEGWQMLAFAVIYVGLGAICVTWGLWKFWVAISSSSGRRGIADRLRRDLLRIGAILLVMVLFGMIFALTRALASG